MPRNWPAWFWRWEHRHAEHRHHRPHLCRRRSAGRSQGDRRTRRRRSERVGSRSRLRGPARVFNDMAMSPEPGVLALREQPVIPEPDVLVPKRKVHGRKPNPVNRPRRREEIDFSDAEKCAPVVPGCGSRSAKRFANVSTVPRRRPSVREIAQPRYACRSCEPAARDPPFTAPTFPPEPVPKSGVGAGLLAQVIVSKCVDLRAARMTGSWRKRPAGDRSEDQVARRSPL